MLSQSTWQYGYTRGYQAPEIIDRMSCSVMTDAFSVGRTIMETLESLCDDESQKNHSFVILHNIACKLCDAMVDTRWSLQRALWEIHHKILKSTTEKEMQEPSWPIIGKNVSRSLQLSPKCQKRHCLLAPSNENESGNKIIFRLGMLKVLYGIIDIFRDFEKSHRSW
jgi:hypothetical protein